MHRIRTESDPLVPAMVSARADYSSMFVISTIHEDRADPGDVGEAAPSPASPSRGTGIGASERDRYDL
jgi:hypothetical protein